MPGHSSAAIAAYSWLGTSKEEIEVPIKFGVGKDLLINIILCLLFFIPGVLHAIWLVTK